MPNPRDESREDDPMDPIDPMETEGSQDEQEVADDAGLETAAESEMEDEPEAGPS
jgi:hypothetical protein